MDGALEKLQQKKKIKIFRSLFSLIYLPESPQIINPIPHPVK